MEIRSLTADEIQPELFARFERHQVVTHCWRKENGRWVVKAVPFTEEWCQAEYIDMAAHWRDTVRADGMMYGAFEEERLIGFAVVSAERFGPEREYLALDELHVSADQRGHGTGRRLFERAMEWARQQGARKLYISAHSSVESQAFYRAVGCVEATWLEPAHVEKEPCDCQLERALAGDACVVQNALVFVQRHFRGDSSGHDAFHTLRVWRLARTLWQKEGGNRLVVELAALLHDVDDAKLFDTHDELGHARAFLAENAVDEGTTRAVCEAIRTVSFKGADTETPATLEGQIVQDADRLDAIGAIGVARAFAYGGSRGRAMYDPDQPWRDNLTAEQYAARQGTTVNHFYEKLFKLAALMNTPSARAMAQQRHAYMQGFLAEFLEEWDDVK